MAGASSPPTSTSSAAPIEERQGDRRSHQRRPQYRKGPQAMNKRIARKIMVAMTAEASSTAAVDPDVLARNLGSAVRGPFHDGDQVNIDTLADLQDLWRERKAEREARMNR